MAYFTCRGISHRDFHPPDGSGGPRGEATKSFGKLSVQSVPENFDQAGAAPKAEQDAASRFYERGEIVGYRRIFRAGLALFIASGPETGDPA